MGSKHEEWCFPLKNIDMFVVLQGLQPDILDINISFFTELIYLTTLNTPKTQPETVYHCSLNSGQANFEVVDK